VGIKYCGSREKRILTKKEEYVKKKNRRRMCEETHRVKGELL